MLSDHDCFAEADVLKAIEIAKSCKGTQEFSVTLIQRKFKNGYIWANRMLEELELRGIIGPYNGKPYREVL
jgi:DNA segregation ATPase FtsK/SpoIIIE-like protein